MPASVWKRQSFAPVAALYATMPWYMPSGMPMNTSPPAVATEPLPHEASVWWYAVFVYTCRHAILLFAMFIAVNAPVVMRLVVGNDSCTPTKDFPPENVSDATAVAL